MWQFLAQNTQKICTYYTDQPNYFLMCIVLHKEGIVEHVLFVGYILVILFSSFFLLLFFDRTPLGYSGQRLLQPWKAMQCKFDPQTILLNFLHCVFSFLNFSEKRTIFFIELFPPEFQWEKQYCPISAVLWMFYIHIIFVKSELFPLTGGF